MILRFSTILLFPILTQASSNTVSITHRSVGTRDYTEGLNVVKTSSHEDDHEYVTSFYKRVQQKVKDSDGLFSKECNEQDSHKSQPQQDKVKPKRRPFAFLQKTLSQDAAGVRGGAASLKKMHSPPSSLYRDKSSNLIQKSKSSSSLKKPTFTKQHQELEFHRDENQMYLSDPEEDYEENNGHYSENDEDDHPPGEHHLGLLRVPCSIAINSSEDRRFQDVDASMEKGGGLGDHNVKKTSIAAYVDTGAQVTVISASAARRAGILHLMDRRYAGRATGVGHCRVLGRIPARHVYFFLGDDEVSCRRGDVKEQNEAAVQMDGPALTVLEGTVTKGVDMLLGLDVLQDWDAEIRMGADKSITVKKKKGKLQVRDSIVIPFVSQHGEKTRHSNISRTHGMKDGQHDKEHRLHSNAISHQSKARQYSASKAPAKSSPHHGRYSQNSSIATRFHRRHHDSETASSEDDDEYFSPTTSDIESDLDMLEKSSHDVDDLDEDTDSEILPRDIDNEMLSKMKEEDDDDDGYLHDIEDEDSDQGHFDMSGL